jgi:hypothetical protein
LTIRPTNISKPRTDASGCQGIAALIPVRIARRIRIRLIPERRQQIEARNLMRSKEFLQAPLRQGQIHVTGSPAGGR